VWYSALAQIIVVASSCEIVEELAACSGTCINWKLQIGKAKQVMAS